MDLNDNPFEGALDRANEHEARVEGIAEKAVKLLESDPDSYRGFVDVRSDLTGNIIVSPKKQDTMASAYREAYSLLRENGIEVAWSSATSRGEMILALEPYDYIHGAQE
jgi:Cdc6-like AAA superfamily ATPase